MMLCLGLQHYLHGWAWMEASCTTSGQKGEESGTKPTQDLRKLQLGTSQSDIPVLYGFKRSHTSLAASLCVVAPLGGSGTVAT